MAVTCGFFNSLGGDRKYPANDISRIFDGVIRDGVYMSIGDKFAVTATTGMTVNVGSGRAWFNHTWTLNDADLPILMDDPDLVLDRIDAIVLEINRSEEVRNNVIKAVNGTASSSPQNPVMVNTEFIEQVPFAYINRKHGVTEIKTEDIKIVVGTSECPYVTSILEAADIDELFAQWDAQFNTWQDSQKAEFTAWFEGIRGQLGEDPAGHLQNQINNIINGQSVPNSGIAIYVHTRSGSVNELTGSGPNGRALITSDIQEGDTWTVNGSPVIAYMGAEDATSMMAGQPYTRKWVTFVFDGESVNFKGGGGSVTVEGLSADVVLAGNVVKVLQGSKTIESISGQLVQPVAVHCGRHVFQSKDEYFTTDFMSGYFDVASYSGSRAITLTAKKAFKAKWNKTSGSDGSKWNTSLTHNKVKIPVDTPFDVSIGDKILIAMTITGGPDPSVTFFAFLYRIGGGDYEK